MFAKILSRSRYTYLVLQTSGKVEVFDEKKHLPLLKEVCGEEASEILSKLKGSILPLVVRHSKEETKTKIKVPAKLPSGVYVVNSYYGYYDDDGKSGVSFCGLEPLKPLDVIQYLEGKLITETRAKALECLIEGDEEDTLSLLELAVAIANSNDECLIVVEPPVQLGSFTVSRMVIDRRYSLVVDAPLFTLEMPGLCTILHHISANIGATTMGIAEVDNILVSWYREGEKTIVMALDTTYL